MRKVGIAVFLIGLLACATAGHCTSYYWEFNGTLDGWTEKSGMSAWTAGTYWAYGKASGGDPYVKSPSGLNINASKCRYLVIQMAVATNSTGVAEFFFQRSSDSDFAAGREVFFTTVNDAVWREYVVDMSTCSLWNGTVTRLRLDPTQGPNGGEFYVNYIRAIEDTSAPSVPSSVGAAAQSTSSIQVSWTASTDSGGGWNSVDSYRVYRNGTQVATPSYTSGSTTSPGAGGSWNTSLVENGTFESAITDPPWSYGWSNPGGHVRSSEQKARGVLQ